MIKKALFVGAIGLIALVSAFGLGRNATTGRATANPTTLQPFAPDFSRSGLSAVALGDTATGGTQVNNLTQTDILRGQRIAIPWIFADPGWAVPLDMDPLPGPYTAPKIGDVIVTLDVNCDSPADGQQEDKMANANINDPWPWNKTTTAVQGSTDAFLYAMVPPYPWLFRDTAHATRFWLKGISQVSANVWLNTVFTTVPWSPNGGANTATTKNGGDAHVWQPATDGLCIDTPQTSTSHTVTNFSAPLLGDTGLACDDPDSPDYGHCADAAVYGPVANVALGKIPNLQTGAGTVAMSANYVNRGPDAGNFTSHWEIEATGAANATWASGGLKTLDQAVPLAKATTVPSGTENMAVTCSGSGEGLIVVKNVLWPGGSQFSGDATKDYFPADNANVFTVKVICTTDASTLVDLSEVELLPVKNQALTFDPPTGVLSSKPEQINLTPGQTATVGIRNVVANNATSVQTATEILNAETSGVVTATWGTATLPNGGNQAGGGTDTTTIAGVALPLGQSNVIDNLTVGCPSGATAGRYSVVIKGIVAPTDNGELKPQDNAQRLVIMVNCWTPLSDPPVVPAPRSIAVPDPYDDGMGLYPRWVLAESNPDSRMSFAQPPSFPQDDNYDSKLQEPVGGYVERTLQLGCYWLAPGGCFKDALGGTPCDTELIGTNTTPFYTPADTQEDFRFVAEGGLTTLDPDGDCLIDSGDATAGRPSDLPDAFGSSEMCTAQPYTMPGGPSIAVVAFKKNGDQDCDGLPDGVEVSWGSNPIASDTDGDTATDYVEMFDFTNPLNTDTDADSFLDKPSAVFGTQTTDKSFDNCPTVSNPDQLNTWGKSHTMGTSFTASTLVTTTTSSLTDGRQTVASFGADGAVTTTDTTLNDTRQAWGVNMWVGKTVTSNSKTMVVTTNTATTLNGYGWNAGGNPGNGNAYTINPQPWTTDQWKGQKVVVGTKIMVITGNSATTLNGSAWNPTGAPGSNKAYLITASPSPYKASNPTKVKVGDACNPDIDADGLPNTVEGISASNPINPDSDNNHCLDGPKALLGVSLTDSSKVCSSVTFGAAQEKFFRACRWNLPISGAFGGTWNQRNSNQTPLTDRTELDAWGVGLNCLTSTGAVGNNDANKDTLIDSLVVEGYYANPVSKDTDGDTCADWVQINDVNGDGFVNSTDLGLISARGSASALVNAPADLVLDVNKDGFYNASDTGQAAINQCTSAGKIGTGGCGLNACINAVY